MSQNIINENFRIKINSFYALTDNKNASTHIKFD